VVRRALQIIALLLLAGLAVAAGGLSLAHLEMRRLGGPLPRELDAVLASPDLPVRAVVANTASQVMPRAQVLDPRRDPAPGAPYEMAHPAFLFAWADGRRLLVDAGMEPQAALAFGRRLELVGAIPAAAHGSAAEQLRDEIASAPLAMVFTHLHVDHTQGIGALCAVRGGAGIVVFQTRAQAERRNYTTRPGAAQLAEAACARTVALPDAPLAPLPGYGGVGVILAAGHTPGSQIVIAAVRGEGGATVRLALAGDVSNAHDGIVHDVPKPLLYRLLVVPENDARLGEVRRFLAHLEQAGFAVAPSHDLLQLRALRLPFAR
jgi:glyoxylase-like metal-dependent hydrolase (beta-lactamase superfamily II)